MTAFGFDQRDYQKGSTRFPPVPEDIYTIAAVEAEKVPTKRGDGEMIKVKFEITQGAFTGRKVWHYFNLNNPNKEAERIGREQILSWTAACGRPASGDTDEVISTECQAKIVIVEGRGDFGPSNKIRYFVDRPGKSKCDAPPPVSDPPPAKAEFDDDIPY